MTTERGPDGSLDSEQAEPKAKRTTRRTAARKTGPAADKSAAGTKATAGSAKKAAAGSGKKPAAGRAKKPAEGGASTRRATGARKAPAGESAPSAESTPAAAPRALPRLQERFRSEIVPQLIREFSYASPMQAPRLVKVVLNIGIGAEAIQNSKAIEGASRDLTMISGQRPVTTRARKSIAGFKIREGMPMGLTVTLRGRRMYEFFDRLISSTLPRIRDFRGVSRRSFDGRGNFALGISEQVIFPEIDYNSIDRIRGLEVAVVTTAPTDPEGLRLLELLGVPFAGSEADTRAA